MVWKKPDPDLVKLLDEKLATYQVQRRTMFGCPTYFVGGNMFAGVHQDTVMLRVNEGDRARMEKEFGRVMPFEPIPGRAMREYVTVPKALLEKKGALTRYLKKSYELTASMPVKAKKPKSRVKK